MDKKIVILNASPRKDKYCDTKVKDIINKGFELTRGNIVDIEQNDYKIINIYDLNLECCNACGYCENKKGCRINDDMTDLYKLFDEMDMLVVVSPVYFNSIPAKFKILVDRLQAVYNSKYKLNDPIIDRSKKRQGVIYLYGGQELTPYQFYGSLQVVDIFFKAVNTKINNVTCFSNTDSNNPESKLDFITGDDEYLESYYSYI